MRKILNKAAGRTYRYMTVSFSDDSELADKVETLAGLWECSETELTKRALREFFERLEKK